MPASEYYAIYRQSKKNSVTNKPNEELKDLSTAAAAAISAEGSADETMEKSQAAEVKVQGGGIAER